MQHIGHRVRTAVALLFIFATLVPAGVPPTRAVHPGLTGGLTYPVSGGIRVHQVGGSYYDIPYAGMTDIPEAEPMAATDVTWTPDGRFLAFRLLASESTGIYTANAAGCHVRGLNSGYDDRAPAFDGINMFFTRGSTGMQLNYGHDHDTTPVSGEPEPSRFGTDVAVSIIEGRFAYVDPPDASHPDEYVLMLLDVFTRDERVEVFRSEDPIRGTEWMPDGSVLAFEATAEDGSTQIFAADVIGDPIVAEQITDEMPNAMAPAFSPDGESMAWFRAADDRQSGVVYVRDLASGEDTFVTQQAKSGLDWQPVLDAPGWEPAVPIETTTTVSLDEPSTGPALHAFTVTVSPPPPDGEVEIIVDDEEPYVIPLDDGAGTAHGAVELDVGAHLISAAFPGACPHRSSAGQVAVEVPEPGPSFDDIGDARFPEAIEWLVDQGITTGCAPDLFCPKGEVTRGQMASFIARARDLADATSDHFSDDDGTTHEDDINRMAEAGITSGCGPGAFCPHATLTRAEMASFLARALDLPAATQDWFDDDDGRTHEANTNRLAEAQITSGCGTRRFCPTRTVTRDEMAAFLYRALS